MDGRRHGLLAQVGELASARTQVVLPAVEHEGAAELAHPVFRVADAVAEGRGPQRGIGAEAVEPFLAALEEGRALVERDRSDRLLHAVRVRADLGVRQERAQLLPCVHVINDGGREGAAVLLLPCPTPAFLNGKFGDELGHQLINAIHQLGRVPGACLSDSLEVQLPRFVKAPLERLLNGVDLCQALKNLQEYQAGGLASEILRRLGKLVFVLKPLLDFWIVKAFIDFPAEMDQAGLENDPCRGLAMGVVRFDEGVIRPVCIGGHDRAFGVLELLPNGLRRAAAEPCEEAEMFICAGRARNGEDVAGPLFLLKNPERRLVAKDGLRLHGFIPDLPEHACDGPILRGQILRRARDRLSPELLDVAGAHEVLDLVEGHSACRDHARTGGDLDTDLNSRRGVVRHGHLPVIEDRHLRTCLAEADLSAKVAFLGVLPPVGQLPEDVFRGADGHEDAFPAPAFCSGAQLYPVAGAAGV